MKREAHKIQGHEHYIHTDIAETAATQRGRHFWVKDNSRTLDQNSEPPAFYKTPGLVWHNLSHCISLATTSQAGPPTLLPRQPGLGQTSLELAINSSGKAIFHPAFEKQSMPSESSSTTYCNTSFRPKPPVLTVSPNKPCSASPPVPPAAGPSPAPSTDPSPGVRPQGNGGGNTGQGSGIAAPRTEDRTGPRTGPDRARPFPQPSSTAASTHPVAPSWAASAAFTRDRGEGGVIPQLRYSWDGKGSPPHPAAAAEKEPPVTCCRERSAEPAALRQVRPLPGKAGPGQWGVAPRLPPGHAPATPSHATPASRATPTPSDRFHVCLPPRHCFEALSLWAACP